MKDRQRERETCNAVKYPRKSEGGGERERMTRDREATTERGLQHEQPTKSEGERESDHDREAARESQRDMQHASISKEE